MNENIDLTKILKENPIGVKVGKLTILREVEKSKHPNGRTSRRFECICDCGNKTYALLDNLKNTTLRPVVTAEEKIEKSRWWLIKNLEG